MIIQNALGVVRIGELKWSKTAIECYEIGCQCKKCDLPKKIESEFKCGMKTVVLELVKKFGAPECKKQITSTNPI